MPIGTPTQVGTQTSAGDSNAYSGFTAAANVVVGDMMVVVGTVGGIFTGLTRTCADQDAVNVYTPDFLRGNDNSGTDFMVAVDHGLVTDQIESADFIRTTFAGAGWPFFSIKRAYGLKCSGLAGTLETSNFGEQTGAGTSSAVNTNNINTTTPNCLLIAVVQADPAVARTCGAVASWTELRDASSLCVAYRIVSSTGTYNYAPTLSAADQWTAWIGAYPMASTAKGIVVQRRSMQHMLVR